MLSVIKLFFHSNRFFKIFYLSHPIIISHPFFTKNFKQMKRFLIAAAALACFSTACNTSTTSTNATTTDTSRRGGGPHFTEMKQAALDATEAVNNHDADALFKDAAPDFTDYGDGNMAPVQGVDSGKAFFKQFVTAFPDIKGENLMAVAEGNHVAVFGDWSGTFKGEAMGMKPTGKSFKVKDVDVYTFNDEGKLTEHRGVQSMETIMSQVGAKMK
jgi:predicted ester cyclase